MEGKRSPGVPSYAAGRMPWSRSAGVGSTGRRRWPAERGLTGGGDRGEDMARWRLQRGHPRPQRFDTAGACRALGPQAPLAPEAPWPNRPLGGVGRGRPPGVPHDRPQGLPPLAQRPAGALRLGPPTRLARCQQPLPCLPHGPHRAGQGPLGPRPLADPRPPRQPLPGWPLHGFPPSRGSVPRARSWRRCPAADAPRTPAVATAARGRRSRNRHHPPQKRSPQRAWATGPPRDARTTHPVPHSVTAVHSQARGCPARPPVSSRSAAGGGWTGARAAATGSAPACTVACARWAIVPRPSGTPNESSRARGVVRCDSC